MAHTIEAIKAVTGGEKLFQWLAIQHLSASRTSRLLGQTFLHLSGRPSSMGQYLEGLVLSYSFARLMTAAKSIFSDKKPVGDCIKEMRSYSADSFFMAKAGGYRSPR